MMKNLDNLKMHKCICMCGECVIIINAEEKKPSWFESAELWGNSEICLYSFVLLCLQIKSVGIRISGTEN
jgi:hypothetical protein